MGSPMAMPLVLVDLMMSPPPPLSPAMSAGQVEGLVEDGIAFLDSYMWDN